MNLDVSFSLKKTLILSILFLFFVPVAQPAEVILNDGSSRVVTGDWAAWTARGIHDTPEPVDVSVSLIERMLSESHAEALLPYAAAIAVGVREHGWAQFEQEPEQVPTARKLRLYAAKQNPDSLHMEFLNVVDNLLASATANLTTKEIDIEHFDPAPIEDRSVYVSFLSVENMVLYQEHLQKQFFESMIDLDYPGLEAVRSAYNQKQIALAIYELSEYYRRKQTPSAFIRKPVDNPKSNTDARCEAICRHEFTNRGITIEFGPRIDWSHHRVDVAEWLWSLNNLGHFVTLLNGYIETANEKYAKEFVDQITDWIVQNPAPPYTLTRVASWRNLEAGNRCTDTLPAAFYGFLSSPEFTPQAIQLTLGSLWSHGDYLLNHPAGLRRPSNWSVIDSTGLAAVSIYFPEFRESETWREDAYERLAYQLDLQVYPDGAQWELAPSYHLYCLSRFQKAFDLAADAHLDIPDAFGNRLESMYEFLMWICKPNGTVPAFSDSKSNSVNRVLLDGANTFDRKDFRYVASGGEEGTAPPETSHILPWSGYAVMRSGWDDQALYLCFDGGPLGTNHQHDDKLSFVLSAYGSDFMVDPGPYLYTRDRWRQYALSTEAHSTILIDGEGQNRLSLERELEALETPEPIWQSNSQFDYTNSIYDSGYGDAEIPVPHKRHILFRKPDYWIIVDEVDGEGEHLIESLFHFSPDVETTTGKNFSVRGKHKQGPSLLVQPCPVPGLEAVIIEGIEEPSVQGWYLPDEEHRRPAPVASYRVEAELPTTLVYLFYPFGKEETEEIELQCHQKGTDILDIAVIKSGNVGDTFRLFLNEDRVEYLGSS